MRGVSLPTLDVMRFNHGWAEGSEPEVSAGGVRGSRGHVLGTAAGPIESIAVLRPGLETVPVRDGPVDASTERMINMAQVIAKRAEVVQRILIDNPLETYPRLRDGAQIGDNAASSKEAVR